MTLQRYVDEFASRSANGRGQPAWLLPIRRAAMERFRALGFPTTREEDWHFTSTGPIAEADFLPLKGGGDVQPSDLEPYTFARDWTQLVFVNGRYASELSTRGRLPARVRVSSLAAALSEDLPAVRAHLTTLASFEHNAFAALNTALFSDGGFVHLGANAACEEPIHLLFIADSEAAKGVAHPRTLVVAEPNARATIVESYVGLGDPTYFMNPVTEVALGEGSHIAHLRIQRESERAYHVGTTQVAQAGSSQFTSFSFATGAALSRINIYTVLAGAGGEATLNGLYMVDGTQHMDHQTRIEHVAPHCTSHEVYKGVLDGAAHGVFNGKVYVHPEAQKTDGKQTNNNLLLSSDAHVDTKPQLEIFADDVKCTHGATVGQLDVVALFYLRSRGLALDEARTLLTYAFAADVVERIEEPQVRDRLQMLTRERFVGVPLVAAG